MGQWFRIVNLDKREWMDTRAFREKTLQDIVFAEDQINVGGLLTYLLRQSDHSGGGDLGVRMMTLDATETDLSHEEMTRLLAAKARQIENVPLSEEQKALVYAGRWAGDRITMIGDYDSGGLYDAVATLPRWTELSYEALADEFMAMILKPAIEAARAIADAEMLMRNTGNQTAPDHAMIVLDPDGFDEVRESGDAIVVNRFDRP